MGTNNNNAHRDPPGSAVLCRSLPLREGAVPKRRDLFPHQRRPRRFRVRRQVWPRGTMPRRHPCRHQVEAPCALRDSNGTKYCALTCFLNGKCPPTAECTRPAGAIVGYCAYPNATVQESNLALPVRSRLLQNELLQAQGERRML